MRAATLTSAMLVRGASSRSACGGRPARRWLCRCTRTCCKVQTILNMPELLPGLSARWLTDLGHLHFLFHIMVYQRSLWLPSCDVVRACMMPTGLFHALEGILLPTGLDIPFVDWVQG